MQHNKALRSLGIFGSGLFLFLGLEPTIQPPLSRHRANIEFNDLDSNHDGEVSNDEFNQISDKEAPERTRTRIRRLSSRYAEPEQHDLANRIRNSRKPEYSDSHLAAWDFYEQMRPPSYFFLGPDQKRVKEFAQKNPPELVQEAIKTLSASNDPNFNKTAELLRATAKF